MTSIKIKFRASSVQAKEGTLFIQVIHNRVVRQVNTGCKLYPFEWNSLDSAVVLSDRIEMSRRSYLNVVHGSVRKKIVQLRGIIKHFEDAGKPYTSDSVVQVYHALFESDGFLSFIRSRITHFSLIGRHSASEKLQSALNSFLLFHGDGDILWGDVDANLMEEYEGFLKKKGVCMNTVSFYMRTLRSAYNVAVKRGIILQQYPFRSVYTGIDNTLKRAVPLNIIRQIRNLDLASVPALDWARDLFLFSFYTRGMSFVDMSFLKKKDLQDGILVYRRRKTNQRLVIKWEKQMQEIIDKYDTSNTPYLLPIIRDTHSDARKQYKNAIHLVNSKLKEIGAKIGLGIPLTTYVARHGWASIAKSKNIPIATISEALGHESEKTTHIYLASLDTSIVDKANSQILKLL